ncbi:DUF2807 domain-containing protein [Ichthyenterobacterium sp. W332]|uniref:DUF2807 domain-containing protein n=1 Tax=Microcosmobacter mediterraneus TaxID=3075607 RepID=A0ABU2YLU1_9FLAO|nr:DUF2807 domain-containing protein [Ichthyenterobacterium sp. W332]MDT0559119.1 DUF2807 domain-containing protein [Ichthyenterobacterium sp. W332]
MRKLLSILALIMVTSTTILAQEKIKGNRDVTIKQSYVDAFEKIVISNDFEIEIAYNEKPSVEIETDDNLHEVIQFGVNEGTLSFSTTKKITSKKKLHIIVYYSNILNSIELNDGAEIRSLTSLELKHLDLKSSGNSRAYLNIRTGNFNYQGREKGKARLNVTADSSKLELIDNNKVEALINSKSVTIDLYQRSDISLEGNSETSELQLDNSAGLSGKNFTTKTCNLILEGRSSATLTVMESITLEASGNTSVYLYGEPSIVIDKFTGTAKLQKRMQ